MEMEMENSHSIPAFFVKIQAPFTPGTCDVYLHNDKHSTGLCIYT